MIVVFSNSNNEENEFFDVAGNRYFFLQNITDYQKDLVGGKANLELITVCDKEGCDHPSSWVQEKWSDSHGYDPVGYCSSHVRQANPVEQKEYEELMARLEQLGSGQGCS